MTAAAPAGHPLFADLTGRRVLLVGGTSGTGRASAELARRLGAAVVVAGRDPDRLAAARARLGGIEGHTVDADRPGELSALLDRVAPDDVVLSTSGPFSAPLADLDVEEGLAYVRSRIAPLLTVAAWAARRPGALRTVTLVGGFVLRKPAPGLATWAFAGPGLVGLVESLALELAPTRVNEVAPSMVIDSPVSDRYFATEAEREARRRELERTTPARHAITVADVARQVVGLIADPALTGTVRTVDAGHSLA